MNTPQQARRIVSRDQDLYPDYSGASQTSGRPSSGPQALIRVSQDGVCLEVEPFDRFDPLPSPSSLLGAHVGQAFPTEIGAAISTEVRDGGVHRRVRQVSTRGHRLSVEISPTRDGTFWVRLRHLGGDVATRPARPGAARASLAPRKDQAWFRVDDDGRIADWNAGAALVTGLTADAVVGRLLSELSGDEGRWADRFKDGIAVAAETDAEFEDWVWRPDGQRVCVAVSLKSAPAGYSVSLRDVTVRRRRDSRAAALYAVGRVALDAKNVDDLIKRTLSAMCDALDWEVGLYWEPDPTSAELRCRRGVTAGGAELVGISADDGSVSIPRGHGLAGSVWADGRAQSTCGGFETHPVLAPAGLSGRLRSGFGFPVGSRFGMLGVFEFASRAVEAPSVELLRTVAIVGNHVSQFSDRFRTEQALRESDAQKAAILSNALDGIITVDEAGRIIDLNTEAERTFGTQDHTMLGRDLSAFAVDPDDGAKLRSELTELARIDADPADSGRRLQGRFMRTSNEEFPVDLSITRIPLDGPHRFSICVRDLTEQERLQEALHHAQKMESLGLLASGIAHDFNNFLTVIRGQAERLVKNMTEDDTRRKWVKSILKVSERASALTGQLLAFGRREAGRVSVVDLNAVIESTAGLLSQQLGDRVVWKAALSPTAGPARVGEGQLQQILFNLALNARDAMPDGGTLQVGTRDVNLSVTDARRLLLAPGPYVLMWVKDTGRGMDARTQSRVFEPFFTTKKLGDGTGLGLSTVYAIVQQCGGQIMVSSRVDEGTTFEVYFPRVSRHPVAATELTARSPDQALAGLTVLLAEDEDEIREIIRDALEQQGCQVLEAANGMAALDRCTEHQGPIQLLLTDMMMPGMTGHQLAERFVRLRPDTSVMFVSGHPEAEVGDDTLIGRRVSLLRKPFSSDELVEQVIQVVKKAE